MNNSNGINEIPLWIFLLKNIIKVIYTKKHCKNTNIFYKCKYFAVFYVIVQKITLFFRNFGLCLKNKTMHFPNDLKYSKEHGWVKLNDHIATFGITDFAQGELGDIVYVEVETLGETLGQDEVYGTLEAVKTVSDLFLPIGGKIVEFNKKLEDEPELINTDPYGEGWIIRVQIDTSLPINTLLDSEAYKEYIGI